MTSLAAVEQVTCGYGVAPVLTELSLTITAGERVAIVGRNGTGKTTLLKLLAGHLRNSSGRVSVLGCDLSTSQPDLLVRSGLAVVTASRDVFPSMTVKRNLEIAARCGSTDRQNTAISAIAPHLADKMAVPAASLSGGERSLLCLILALSLSPSLLLIDELSEGLQPEALSRVIATLKSIGEHYSMAVFFSEQDPAVVDRVATRTLMIQNGRLSQLEGPR